ncbi:MAG TPA: helix-turn-helix transcriptional regulator [Desulfitobacterium dehalogenans]|uniref:Helix-turn-helix transcriptional regulator n=1 Tax=Desulfitobacterium dehalogenans TaxID=36854 RepID=A0A7C7D669_9FIRM|nr:helix-turn-helix transcriptional regulator [Desulfitobacterium dehalogenans]
MSPKVSEDYKKERERELIEAAKKVFIEKGFVRTSMQDIMDKAGISCIDVHCIVSSSSFLGANKRDKY